MQYANRASLLALLISVVPLACDFSRRFRTSLLLVGAKIYPSPLEPPIDNGSILVHDGRILAVGPTRHDQNPARCESIDCKGLVVTAGFWNSHVHIIMPGLYPCGEALLRTITSQLEEMLTRGALLPSLTSRLCWTTQP